MAGVVIVGAQWGDEGKGKVVDHYAKEAQVVVRFCGGANAGHTVVHAGKKYKFNLLPSGVLYPKKTNILGNGTVIEPQKLLEELSELKAADITPSLIVSPKAHVVLPIHKELDAAEEEHKKASAAGTTKRGIGPTYADKAARFGLRFEEFCDEEALREKLPKLFALKEKMLAIYGKKPQQDASGTLSQYLSYSKECKKYLSDASLALNNALAEGKNVLFEGAQATMLDIDHGFYPYCTSSNTTAGGACTGSGVGPTAISEVIGVVKVYTSRVGEGPIPSEIFDSTAEKIRERGGEFGTVTRRPRRIGWLDLVTLRYSKMVNGLSGLAFTRLDTLSGFEKVKICVAYELEGKRIEHMPLTSAQFALCRPVYKEFGGWEDLGEGWGKCAGSSLDAIPKNARSYLSFVSKELATPICFVGIGPSREHAIVLKDVFCK